MQLKQARGCHVAVADIEGGRFVRRPRESCQSYTNRLCEGGAGSKTKMQRLARLARAGTALPPPLLFQHGHETWVDDGFHRVGAAALAGNGAIECVVVPVATHAEADELSELLYDLEHFGAPPWVAIGAIAASNKGDARHV